MNGVECEYATGNGFCCLSACNNINLLGNVVPKEQPQSLNVRPPKASSNWHTGTPTEEGWYLIKYRGIYGSAIGRTEYRAVHRYRLDGFPMIDGGIGADDIWKPIEWQKIEEKENGHTD